MGIDEAIGLLGLGVVGPQFLLLGILGLWSLVDRPLSERMTSRLVLFAILAGLLSALALSTVMLLNGTAQLVLDWGNWVEVDHYRLSAKLLLDALSLPFVVLALVVCGTVAVFANRYMHREPGYNRFFVLYALFMAGMTLTALAGTIETLFAGWELVGLSSAFLVAFFHERPMPARNGLRVWAVYRIADACFLAAAIVLHHMSGEGDFGAALGSGPWPEGNAPLTQQQALIVGLLLLVAAAGKSALIPFSGWLPRAMEGPTPSSAVFYGAISVHLGAFLLLRVSPILEQSPILAWSVVAWGLITAAYAGLAGRAQTDIKSALAFASLTQVGIIVAEIGLGFRFLALAHMMGHVCLRTLQFLRAPTLLHDYHVLENAIGQRLSHAGRPASELISAGVRAWWYRFALERGYLDALLCDYIVHPFLQVFQWCDAAERRVVHTLSGGKERESDRHRAHPGSLDELI